MARIHILDLQEKTQQSKDLQDLVIEETNLVKGGTFSLQGAVVGAIAGGRTGSLGGPYGVALGGIVGFAIGGFLGGNMVALK